MACCPTTPTPCKRPGRHEVDDALWAVIAPLLPPPPPPKAPGGRPRLPDRGCLNGILYVLATGIAWADLPPSAGWGSGQTCWRRLREWTEAGVWVSIHAMLLAQLDAADAIGWERASVDASAIRALAGGDATGRNPTDRGRAGTKHHILGDREGLPLSAALTGANRHDTVPLAEVLDAVPLRDAATGGPKRPDKLHADKAFDGAPQRALVEERGITPRFARKGIEPADRLGRYRWSIERTFAWLHRFRRLRVRYERRADLHLALLYLACILITWRFCRAAGLC